MPTLASITYERDGKPTTELHYEAAENEIWATQAQIADVFGVTVPTINEHLKNLVKSEELDEDSVVRKFRITAADGKSYLTALYSLDAIIAVGYRVSSKEATRFRSWSSKIVRTYLEQGYVLNEKALRESPDKLNKLAAEVRAIRASEKQVYAKVRECFRISASDYHPEAGEVRRFYILLQEKFHHAVTGMTSSKIVLDRADHTQENVGLQTMTGKNPTIADVETGKNYLRQEELYRLHLLSEQFLLYAESTALAKRKMTMSSLHQQLDRLLTLNDYPVFDGYKDYIKDEAIKHARQELIYYRKRKKLEAMGIKYDPEALAYGEYDDILMGEVEA
ncbi:hypothetical protein ASD02_00715 [Ensifer sp. Root1252]|nr:hypothetical protein ASD02_00715 [Ensifer sp. Root1252]KRC84226.1 hypothetical protein ASE32_00710 [Ensifer sp. Root231]KRC86731.1 hypothetical protein ASE47_16940 [Ensifer sp. Root258]